MLETICSKNFVLDAVEFVAYVSRVMVEHDGERAHDLFAGHGAFFVDERVAHQVANDLAAVFRQAASRDQGIEANQEALGHCNREPHKS